MSKLVCAVLSHLQFSGAAVFHIVALPPSTLVSLHHLCCSAVLYTTVASVVAQHTSSAVIHVKLLLLWSMCKS